MTFYCVAFEFGQYKKGTLLKEKPQDAPENAFVQVEIPESTVVPTPVTAPPPKITKAQPEAGAK